VRGVNEGLETGEIDLLETQGAVPPLKSFNAG
jgi:hypothetical protein